MANNHKEIPIEHSFVLGHRHIKDLSELLSAIKEIDESEFKHYVGENHNHFVNWVRDIIKDYELAEKLSGVKSKKKTEEIIEETLNEETAPKEKIDDIKNHAKVDVYYESADDIEKEKEPIIFESEKKSRKNEVISPEDVEEVEQKEQKTADKQKSSLFSENQVHGRHLYTFHMGKEVALSFFIGMMIGIFVGLVIAKMAMIS